ncbi:YchJ family protein [Streptomyces sp. NPDC048172]|uniref:YchJ family protein n=1 Tax=Streptomyces sp. NPDC048172 TaxID=3365505 RepID=UPI00371606C1
MSRRRSQPRRTPAPSSRSAASVAPSAPCPCGLSASYGACCGRFHRGEAAAPTAEALMRSRYAAFAVGDEAYLLRTWHPSTRPDRVDPSEGPRWTGLEILGTTAGSAFHTEGTVTFRAHYTAQGRAGTQEEHSRFVRHEGAWVYLDAVG